MNRQFISLTFLLVLSCSIQGMEVLPQSLHGSGSGSTEATMGLRTSSVPGGTPVASACPCAPQDTGSETVVTTTNQPAQPLLIPGRFSHEICDKIIGSYREQVEHLSPADMERFQSVSRTWRDVLNWRDVFNKEKYGVVIDVSKWSVDRIDKFFKEATSYQVYEGPRGYIKTEKVHGLDCHGNLNITDAVLQAIVATFPQLEGLNLSQCRPLHEYDFSVIAKLTNLKKLNVNDTNIGTDALQAICKTNPNLEELYLGDCDLPDAAFGHLAQLKKLKKLDVTHTNISAAALQDIVKNNPGLEELDISVKQHGFGEGNWPSLSGTDLAHIAALHNLKKLNVSQTRISDAALLDIVTANPGLEELDLGCCAELLGNDFVHITKLKNLKKLDVNVTHINGAALQAIVTTNLNLEELYLGTCLYLSDTDLAHIAELTKLKKLNISRTNISATALRAIVTANPGLEELDLGHCDQLSGDAFGHIARLLEKLTKLYVNSANISTADLQAIVEANPGLEELDLGSVFQLPGDDFGHIAKLHKLKKLNVSGTHISATALRAIVTANPGLEKLGIAATPINGATIGAIAATRPQLTILNRLSALGEIR